MIARAALALWLVLASVAVAAVFPPTDLMLARNAMAPVALAQGRDRYRADLALREPWRAGGRPRLVPPAAMRLVGHRVLDETTAATPAEIAREDAATNALLRDLLGKAEADLRALMGLGYAALIRRHGDALAARLDGRAELAGADPALLAIDRAWTVPAQDRLLALVAAQRARTLAAPPDETAARAHDLAVRPYSLHLLVFEEGVP